MLTAEYAILDGAKAIALPTKYGQKMTIKPARGSDIIWESLDHNGEVWFSATISLLDFNAIKTTDEEIAAKLKKILKNAVRLNSEFLSKWNGVKVETQLEFNKDWGLGSSSTLIYLIAQWADVNPLLLAFRSSNGSGYDVACAGADGPIVYQVIDDSISYTEIDYLPKFADKLFFVYLEKKQKTEDQIRFYTKKVKNKKAFSKAVSAISEELLDCKSFSTFEQLLTKHEEYIAGALELDSAKDQYFSDYWGSIKSLGAWGGDFVLASSDKSKEDTEAYFQNKGFSTVISFKDMVLS